MPTARPSPARGSLTIPARYLAGLYRTPAETWESKIREWDRGAGPMGASYAPLHRSLNHEMENPGGGEAILESETQGFADTPSNRAILANSREALATFRKEWLSEFPELVESFPGGGEGHGPCDFEAHRLKGGFHALVRDRKGRERLLAYHCAKWETNDMRAAHLELLTVVAESRHGKSRGEVRLLDFRSGECLTPNASFKALRKGLLKTADHYLRIFG